jgi:Putative transposase
VGPVVSLSSPLPSGLRFASGDQRPGHFHKDDLYISHPARPRIRRCAECAVWRRFVHTAFRLGFAAQSSHPCTDQDGVYAADDDDEPQFQVLPAPDDGEIARLTDLLAKGIQGFFRRRGLGPDSDPEESTPLARDQPWLAGLYAASVRGRTAIGNNSGRRVTHRGDQIDAESMEPLSKPRCAMVDGFNLHANVAVPAGDRARLERLARYCLRPPVAMERLEQLAGERLLYRFKRAWRDGSTHIVLTPLEMLEKLSALIPSPHAHLVRYAGILAPAAHWRSLIVPTSSSSAETEPTIPAFGADVAVGSKESLADGIEASNVEVPVCRHGRNYTWAELRKRVWALDVLECPRCQGRMRILTAIHSPDAIEKILGCLGLPSRAPPLSHAVPEFSIPIELF